LFGKYCAMPKTTTCFDVIFNGSKARGCFSCTVLIPDCISESNLQERQDHSLCFSQKSLMAAPMSCRLYCSLISNKASYLAPFSFVHRTYSPFAALVCARPLCHRLRYGFLLAHTLADCHATQKSCTVQFGGSPLFNLPQPVALAAKRS
jgi:hypothetical protein